MVIATPRLWGLAVARADADALLDPLHSQLASGTPFAGVPGVGVRPLTYKAPAATTAAAAAAQPAASTLAGKGLFGSALPSAPVVAAISSAQPASAPVASTVAVDTCSSCTAHANGVAASVADETMLSGAVQQSEQVAPVASSSVPKWAWWLFAVLALLAILSGGRK